MLADLSDVDLDAVALMYVTELESPEAIFPIRAPGCLQNVRNLSERHWIRLLSETRENVQQRVGNYVFRLISPATVETMSNGVRFRSDLQPEHHPEAIVPASATQP